MPGDKRSYYRLFGGYVLATLGTGVAVVGLALLAVELGGGEEGAAAAIGTALAIKTLVYVAGAPVAAAVLSAVPRRPLMVTLDLVRAGALLALPFVTALWQLLALVGVFALASSAFTPAYRASVPALLPDARDYAASVSRSQLAQELEGAISPLAAAALLLVLPVRGLFWVAMAAFLASAALIATARLGAGAAGPERPLARLAEGFGLLLRKPALRGLAPLALAAGAGAAVATVDAAPLVVGRFGRAPEDAALALAAFGAGAVAGTLAMPALLARVPARRVMVAGGAAVSAALVAALAATLFPMLLAIWAALGAAVALAQAPAATLIRDAAGPETYQTVHAAHLALSTAAAGLGYAAAGALAAVGSIPFGALALAAVAGAATLAAALLWRPPP